MKTNYQRTGSTSNAYVGKEFEQIAERALTENDVIVTSGYSIEIGIKEHKKSHNFDFGSTEPPILVECKSHRWTSGGNVPSAKITAWNEAMYYFACASESYRKILFVLRDFREKNNETLAEYYVRTHKHLIPSNVEIWEYDEELDEITIVFKSFDIKH